MYFSFTLMYPSCFPHVPFMYPSCTLYVPLMYPPCTPHVPYLADEDSDGTKNFKLPPTQKAAAAKFVLHGVKDTFVTVDLYDNYGSALPLFVLGISLLQTVAFFKYVVDESSPVSSDAPIAGPEQWWMKVMSDFPGCDDLRLEWWRPLTYQLVHAGYAHLGFNMFMQVVFGLPLNMVHGNLRFALLYFLGVFGGALTFTVVGGGHGAMVGCSGGVYSIFGMHVAEIIINWDLQHKGIMNHWTRLMVIAFVLAVDFYLYYTSPSEVTHTDFFCTPLPLTRSFVHLLTRALPLCGGAGAVCVCATRVLLR